ncbi:uncharacterized protein G2W53_041899 [Senna tora]|uniref:Uncharacterized protein n=1 Tax=Senna tora TaxID=362788 RepID=A0A834VYF6_9FABA|nr:uncharacterized protein G2W53_041899 [Senna tora]
MPCNKQYSRGRFGHGGFFLLSSHLYDDHLEFIDLLTSRCQLAGKKLKLFSNLSKWSQRWLRFIFRSRLIFRSKLARDSLMFLLTGDSKYRVASESALSSFSPAET